MNWNADPTASGDAITSPITHWIDKKLSTYKYLKKIYPILSPFLKAIIKNTPYAWIAGGKYRNVLQICKKIEIMPRQEIVALQEKLLGDTLQFAVAEVPFYKPYKHAVEKFKPFDAIKEFRFITKDEVQRNWNNLQPACIRKIPHHQGTTGGSSGNQLIFLEDDSTYAQEMGFMHSQWQRVGYSARCRKATFRGVQFNKITEKVFWQENPIHNELQFSPFHVSEGNLKLYFDKLFSYAPEFLHGYPSAIDVLAEYAIRQNLPKLQSLKAILLGSEPCTEMQRVRITKAFGKPIYTWYGQSERLILGGECEYSRKYHSFPNYGYLEIIKEDGDTVKPGDRGEIIGTAFLNRSMPLIRYRTDDTAIMVGEPCPCGRAWDLFSDVIGRWNIECIYGRSGAKISAAAINMHGDLFNNVIRVQYYQDVIGEVVIRVIPNDAFSEEDEKRIIQEHNRKFWGELKVIVQLVNDIPLTASGKHRRIVCSVSK